LNQTIRTGTEGDSGRHQGNLGKFVSYRLGARRGGKEGERATAGPIDVKAVKDRAGGEKRRGKDTTQESFHREWKRQCSPRRKNWASNREGGTLCGVGGDGEEIDAGKGRAKAAEDKAPQRSLAR